MKQQSSVAFTKCASVKVADRQLVAQEHRKNVEQNTEAPANIDLARSPAQSHKVRAKLRRVDVMLWL
jgi:hypothetical protein